MTKLQYRVLYRTFVSRVLDLEWLSVQGEVSKLLGQIGALLIFVGVGFTFGALGFGDSHLPRATMLMNAWGLEHSLIATTMLVVGVCAVLSWESTFPDRRDVLVLAPLPIDPRALFLAKIAATCSVQSLAVIALCVLPGISWPIALAPPSINLIDLILMPALYRCFAAFWITMLAAGAFIFFSVLGIQGIAAQLLPRRRYLQVSALLQLAAFCFFISFYFLEPSFATQDGMAKEGSQHLLRWLPSYWFLGLFQLLNGSMQPVMEPMASRASAGLAITVVATSVAYLLSYLRTLRQVVEEPDITPSAEGLHWMPHFGSSLETAVAQFSLRTLMRSRQHRVMLAFYLGIGVALVIFILRSGVGRGREFATQADTRLLFSSVIILTLWIVGTRVVFALPITLQANWVFRITEIRRTPEYFRANRQPLFLLAVLPVWIATTVIFAWMWPLRLAAGHVLLLGLWGVFVAYLSLQSFHKIPFTCSYLPGKSFFHMTFLGAIGLLYLVGKAVEFEHRALNDPATYLGMIAVLSAAVFGARWRTIANSESQSAIVQFEDVPPPVLQGLGLHRDAALPD